jgi:putative membrane-bound dehydrogenase-like protein
MHCVSPGRGSRWSAAVLASLWIAAQLDVPVRADLPKVPDGFTIRLVAAVPAVEFPSQVATAPDGSLFVGEDPMDQVGPATKPIDRILLFRDGKEPVVFADKLNAIFGMVWHDGALYVMNMPHLTVLRDRDGDGKADERKDLFTDLGVPAGTPNDFNDHIVSGLKIGIDGYLYISVGDKGVPKATGPDRRTVQVVGGGVVRCRLDGTGVEVYSTGTRNHLEPNLDDRDNLFTYDNTDDGLGWWTRVTHHIDSGYHGYPFDYHDRKDRILPAIAEFGGGSPCGGIFYAEDIWPEKYRGCHFWAEWGQRVVRGFRFVPAGASFKIAEKFELVEPGPVESFRPLDLALTHDGKTLYVADWSSGSWGNKTEKLGRVYAVTYTAAGKVKTRPRGKDSDPVRDQIRQLDHPAFNERFRAQSALIRRGKKETLNTALDALSNPATPSVARQHLVWVVDALAGATPEASYPLMEALKSPDADLRGQAARALGERAVPIAVDPLVLLLKDTKPANRLQAAIALGRIGDKEAIPALFALLEERDSYLVYAARAALRKINDWDVTAKGLDSVHAGVRVGVLLAMEGVYNVAVVDALAGFAAGLKHPVDERNKALQYLAGCYRKAPPWDGKWWGTQPASHKPPARTIDWAGTPKVMTTIRKLLTDQSASIRNAAVLALVETGDRDSRGVLRERFSAEKDTKVKRSIAVGLGKFADQEAVDALAATLRDPRADQPLRDAALEAVETIGSKKAATTLGAIVNVEPLLLDRTRVIAALGRLKDVSSIKPLVNVLGRREPATRAAAIDALVGIVKDKHEASRDEVVRALRPLCTDPALEVRNRSLSAAGTLADREAIPVLISASDKPESRFEAGMALAALPDMRALQVYLRGLSDKNQDLRQASGTALVNLRDKAIPVLDQLAARHELSPGVVPELRSIYVGVVPVTSWQLLGPFPIAAPPELRAEQPVDLAARWNGADGKTVAWRAAQAADTHGTIDLAKVYSSDDDLAAYGYAVVESPSERKAEVVVGSDDTLTVWLNGKQVYEFADRRGFEHDQSRFEVTLAKGANRILIRCGNRGGPWQFALALTAPADYAFLKAPAGKAFNPETYRARAQTGNGTAARGRALFGDAKGLACSKCHSVGKEGGLVGPELSSVGAKYPRDELIASVLYPSAKISSGFESTTFALADGRVLTGIVRNETPDLVEIQDAEAKLIRIAKADIDARKRSDISLMPNGLAEGLSLDDFADLIAYLETLKNTTELKK